MVAMEIKRAIARKRAVSNNDNETTGTEMTTTTMATNTMTMKTTLMLVTKKTTETAKQWCCGGG